LAKIKSAKIENKLNDFIWELDDPWWVNDEDQYKAHTNALHEHSGR
jgi:hypothetical protein